MKKFNSWLLVTAVAICCSILLHSCSEDDNITTQPQDIPVAYADNIDETVSPGDNFYMYSIGSWWNRTELPEESDHYFYLEEVGKLFQEKIDAIESVDEHTITMNRHSRSLFTNAEADQKRLGDALKRVNAAQSREDLWTLMGQLAAEGFQMPFGLLSLSQHGVMGVVFTPSLEKDIASAFEGNDDDDKDDKDDDDFNFEDDGGYNCRAIEPILVTSSTRSIAQEKWPMLVKVCEGMGFAPQQAYVALDDFYELATEDLEIKPTEQLEELQAMDREALAETIEDYILDNMPLYSPEALSQFEEEAGAPFDPEKVAATIGQNYMKYYLSYIFAKNYCTPEMKKRGEADVAELEEAFRERITANTWLSEASKSNVIDKLNAMAVNVSEPDWLEEGLIDLSQTKSFFEDVMEVRKTYFNFIKKLYGMNVQQGSFHTFVGCFTTIMEFNSTYAPNFNSMNILPPFLMDPIYGENSSTATRYAAMTVFGHEITHGFDTGGAEWDKLGDRNSIWASDADANEFKRRAQLMVDYYNTFEIAPGVYADGENTLRENIADLGGVELAFQALTKHLKKQGLTGEALKKEQRNFFVAYANYWRNKYNDEYAESQKYSDEHSLSRERVNGVVTNIDAWYELFDVKPGDKLYRAPEDRIHIW